MPDIVHIAAWIIVSSAMYWLLYLHQKDKELQRDERARRIEENAARLEFDDHQTSDTRRQELLMRYSQVLVDYPRREFVKQAEESEKENERSSPTWKNLTWKQRAGVVFFFVTLGLVGLAGAFGASLLIEFVKGFFPH